MEKHNVKIDGKKNTLTLVYSNGDPAGHYQYNTSGNKSAHTFRQKLRAGQVIYTSGSKYEIID
jgi:hypothetical protein